MVSDHLHRSTHHYISDCTKHRKNTTAQCINEGVHNEGTGEGWGGMDRMTQSPVVVD